MTHSPDGASAGGLDLDELEKVARDAMPDKWSDDRGWENPLAVSAFGATFDPPTVMTMIAALRALSPSPGLGGSAGADIARTGTLPVLTSAQCQSEWSAGHALRQVFDFLADLANADLDESAADGGVTVGMVFQQQARDVYGPRVLAALSSEAPSPKPEDQFPPVADQAVDALSVCERDECWFGGKCAGLCDPEGADVSVAVAQQRAQASSAQEALIPPGFVVAPREVVEALEPFARFGATLRGQPPKTFILAENLVGEQILVRDVRRAAEVLAALPPPGGGKGAYSTDIAAAGPSACAATAPQCKSEGER